MMRLHKYLIIAIILTTASIASRAQDEPVRVETNLVTVNVTVSGKGGAYVKGLKKENFEVLDNRLKQQIDEFSAEEAAVSFGIVYDMHPTTDERTTAVLAALRQFAKELKEKDSYFVTVFNEKGSLTTEFVPTVDQLRTFLSDGTAKGPTSLYDAIFAASEKIRERKNTKRVLLVLTDGADHASHHSEKELRLHLRTVNLPVYAVTFHETDRRQYGYVDLYRSERRHTFGTAEASELDRGVIAELSKTSGGQAFERSIQNRVYLASIFRKVLAEVQNQYVIGFYPENTDGKWHKLKVVINDGTNKRPRVSSRKGYQSPGKAVK